MHVQIPDDAKVLELGGGSAPMLAPKCLGGKSINVDVVPAHLPDGRASVDFTQDFYADKWAIGDSEFDVVLSRFCLEHISYLKVPHFLSEVNRVMKVGGQIYFLIPNTEAQLKWILDHGEGWDNKTLFHAASEKLFGSQDHAAVSSGQDADQPLYAVDSHKCYFNPTIAIELFQAARFENVMTSPYGERATDMLVTGKKSQNVDLTGCKTSYKCQKCNEFVVENTEHLCKMSSATVSSSEFKAENSPSHSRPLVLPKQPILSPGERKVEAEGVDSRKSAVLTQTPTSTIAIDSGVSSLEQTVSATPDSHKTTAARSKLFGLDYFNGGRKNGGFSPFYMDYSCHEISARHILARQPKSVLELGCARGYVLKRIQDAGIEAEGVDISSHAYMTRVCNHIYCEDICERMIVPSRGKFDLCYSIATLEHIPEEFIPKFAEELERVSERGVHGVKVSGGGDKTQCTIKSISWWKKRLPKGHEILNKDDLEAGKFPEEVQRGDGKTKLNIGSAWTHMMHGWMNIDTIDAKQYALQMGTKYLQHDIRNGLPFLTGNVDLIFSHHCLEHLTFDEGLMHLRECRRVLNPETGCMRIAVPNAWFWSDQYKLERMNDFNEMNEGCANARTQAAKLHAMLYHGHQATYDWDTMADILDQAGFVAEPSEFRKKTDRNKQILVETCEMSYGGSSLFVDAIPKV